MSETLVPIYGSAAPEAEPTQPLAPGESQPVADFHKVQGSIAQVRRAEGDDPLAEQNPVVVPAPNRGVAGLENMLNRSAETAPIPMLSERQKRKVVRNAIHNVGLSSDIVAAKDENGKVKMVQDEHGQWRIKARLDLNAYAKHHTKDPKDIYAQHARAAGLGKTASERLRDAAAEKMQALRASKSQENDTSAEKTDWKARTTAILGGLAVGAVAKVTSLKKDTKAKASVVLTSMHDRIKALNGQGQSDVVTTKEMPAVAAKAGVEKSKPEEEQLTQRQKMARAVVGGIAVVSLLAGLTYAAHEADEKLAAGSQTTTAQEGAPADKNEAGQGNENTATEEYPKVDMSDQIYQGAVPGNETVSNNDSVVSASVAERTLSLPDGGNIWNSSRAFLKQQGVPSSNYNIDLVADSVRAAEGLSEGDAEKLSVNYTFTIPADVLTQVK